MTRLNIKAFRNYFPLLILCLGTLAISCGSDDENPDPGNGNNMIDCSGLSPSYASDIQPIIEATCAFSGCHSTDFENGDYTSYDGLKEKVDSGVFAVRVLNSSTRDMPFSNTVGPDELTDEQIELLHCWVEDGAPNN